jgi:hypothetical protein
VESSILGVVVHMLMMGIICDVFNKQIWRERLVIVK